MLSFFQKVKRNGFVIILVMIILYVVLVLYSDFDKVSKSIVKIQYQYVPLILLPMTIHLLLLGVRFHRLIRCLGIDIPFKKSVLIYIAGLFLNVTTGGAGQIIKSHMIKTESGDAISKTAPVIVIEKWQELISVLIILIGTIIVQRFAESVAITIIGICVSLLLYGIMRNRIVFLVFKKILNRFRMLRRFDESVENSRNTLKILTKPRMIIEGLVITIPAKILEAVSVILAFDALNIKLDFITSIQIFFTALVVGTLSFIPGGFGITESSMLVFLSKYGVDFSLAVAAVIFVRLTTIWYATFLGVIMTKFVVKKKTG